MKILAFSDLHLNRKFADTLIEQSVDADIVVGAGDFAMRGEGLDKIIRRLSHIETPTVIIPGNHEHLDALKAACKNWESVHILFGNSITIAGQRLFGLGYEIPRSNYEPWNAYLTEDRANELLQPCQSGDILVTHSPAFGIADQQKDGRHDGSKAIRRIIEEKQPRLHLCGHIHNSWGGSGYIDDCLSFNLGPFVRWFDVAN